MTARKRDLPLWLCRQYRACRQKEWSAQYACLGGGLFGAACHSPWPKEKRVGQPLLTPGGTSGHALLYQTLHPWPTAKWVYPPCPPKKTPGIDNRRRADRSQQETERICRRSLTPTAAAAPIGGRENAAEVRWYSDREGVSPTGSETTKSGAVATPNRWLSGESPIRGNSRMQ